MEWIGVDLDGTLAFYEPAQGVMTIGNPIDKMVERVKAKLAEGVKVKIMTARVCRPSYPDSSYYESSCYQRDLIDCWCYKVFGQCLEVTNVKDFNMTELWDDRAKQVIPNTGEFLEDQKCSQSS